MMVVTFFVLGVWLMGCTNGLLVPCQGKPFRCMCNDGNLTMICTGDVDVIPTGDYFYNRLEYVDFYDVTFTDLWCMLYYEKLKLVKAFNCVQNVCNQIGYIWDLRQHGKNPFNVTGNCKYSDEAIADMREKQPNRTPPPCEPNI